MSERLQDHFQPTPVLAVLGRESPEQFLEGGVPDLQEGLEMDLFEPDLHIVDLRGVHFDPILSEVRPLGKSGYCLGGAKEIIMVNPSALDRETTA